MKKDKSETSTSGGTPQDTGKENKFSFEKFEKAEVSEEIQKEAAGKYRRLHGFPRYLAFGVAVLTTLIVFYTAFAGVFLPMIQRGILICSMFILTFLWYPTTKKTKFDRDKVPVYDWIMVAMSFFCLFWTLSNNTRFLTRIPFSSEVKTLDYVVAIAMVLMILEAGRRTLGLSITVICTSFIAYAFLGPYCPAMFKFKGITLKKFVEQTYLTTEGMFGSLTGMAATLLFGFLAFGTFLQASGADKFFMDICISLAGKRRGGPAKVAVISSAAMGTISGSSIANVVTTGTLTIPMMKKTGYSPEEAAAIETCASTGGQIMPPIMGTGAFILAETVGVPYSSVCMQSIIPALLFYIAIYFLVDLMASKKKLTGLPSEEIPPLSKTFRAGGIFFLPILILVVLLVLGYTPFRSGVGCTILIFLLAQARKETRIGVKRFFEALENCAKGIMSIAGVIFCASLVVSMINITGLMMKTTAIILSFSQGKLWITLLLVGFIGYLLGMGLPIGTSYIILATLSAPALVELGVPMLVAHLTIFWFTQLATITPPVCMTAFAAAGIANAAPMKTGFTALKIGFTFYYVPVLFVYSQLINGTWWAQCIIAVVAIVAIYFLGTFTERYFMGELGRISRFGGLLIFLLLYYAMFDSATWVMRGILTASSAAIILAMYTIQRKKQQSSQHSA